MTGFADVAPGEACVRPGRGDAEAGRGVTPTASTAPTRDSLEGGGEGFLDRLSADARRRALEVIRAAPKYDPLEVSQDDLDAMSDDERWQWLDDTVRREEQLRREETAAAQQEEWTAAQDTIGGTP